MLLPRPFQSILGEYIAFTWRKPRILGEIPFSRTIFDEKSEMTKKTKGAEAHKS